MNAKVLLVDDSKTALLMGETIFKQHTSCQVVTARDGEEGVRKSLAETPDLILLDVVMPKMDGFAACQEMRKNESLKNVPIIMVTSRGEPTNVATGYSSGCNAYLTKPINARELLEIVRMFLGLENETPRREGLPRVPELIASEYSGPIKLRRGGGDDGSCAKSWPRIRYRL